MFAIHIKAGGSVDWTGTITDRSGGMITVRAIDAACAQVGMWVETALKREPEQERMRVRAAGE